MRRGLCPSPLLMLIAAVLLMGLPVRAATFTVTTLTPTGPGSLTEAMANANTNGQADVINISVAGTITLNAPLPIVLTDMTINGLGSGTTFIDGNNTQRGFFVRAGTLALNDLTIRNCRHVGGNGGGGSGGGAAGMGAALFVNTGATAIVDEVNFTSNLVQGGNGGSASGNPTGGGGGGGISGAGGAGGGNSGGDGGGLGGGEGGTSISGTDPGAGGGGGGGDFLGGFGGDGMGDTSASTSNRPGGEGGGGGGGGTGGFSNNYHHGGSGGFGGGGGGGSRDQGGGGSGGFGGGGGGTGKNPGLFNGGSGGQFGGSGGKGGATARGGAGGGAGLGGAIFVRDGGTLQISNAFLNFNRAERGLATTGSDGDNNKAGSAGQGKGGAIFVMTNGTAVRGSGVTFGQNNFAFNAGVTETDNHIMFGEFTSPPLDAVMLSNNAARTVGQTQVFEIEATGGAQPLTYQWSFRPESGGSFSGLSNVTNFIAGATTDTLTLSNIVLNFAGDYRCTVTDNGGAHTTTTFVTLTVQGDELGGPNVWVDFAFAGPHAGTQANPVDTLEQAVLLVESGGTLHIAPGTTPETITISKPMTLQNDNPGQGPVRIGL
jgi:hypothetical protein